MVTLVTGCRSGFGLLTAVEAARRGHTVYAGLRDLSTADRLAEAAQGLDVRPVQLDVTVGDQRDQVVEQILAEQGHIDALVNNAGVALGGFLEQVEEDELRRVFEVNVFGVHALTQRVLPTMRSRKRGSLIMVSSMSGRMAFPCLGTYASSKFALEGMTEAWRHELKPWGIDVVLVEPGAYTTDIWTRNRAMCRRARDADSPYAPWVEHMDSVFKKLVDRQARPAEEVAVAICDMIDRPHNRLRHPMGSDAWLRSTLLRLAPFGLIERVVQRTIRPPS